MKRKYLRIFYFTLVCTFLSCNKEVRKVGKTIESNKIGFQFFKTKARIKYTANGESIAASMNLRIQNEKLIWMSLSKYGKEAMRAKVSPDSAHYLNKYPTADRYYKVIPTQEYLSKAGLDLDFKAAQDLMFGIHPLKIERKDSVVMEDSSIYVMQKREGVKINSVLDVKTSRLKTVRIISKTKTDTLNLSYQDYKYVDNHFIPTTFVFDVSNLYEGERLKTQAEINFTSPKFEIDKPSFSFKVPSGYEKR